MGRRAIGHAGSGSEAGRKKSVHRLPPLCALKKTGIQGDESPWQVLEDSVLEVLPFKHAEI